MSFGKTAPSRFDDDAPNLTTLAPQYSFEAHGVYFTILKSTIDSKPNVRNIALAGTYGAGKSSVLSEIGKAYPKRVVEVSLLTLGAKEDLLTFGTDPSSGTNPAASSKTNRIQKEIVKQLLYQQKPTRSPGSRFHRIVRVNPWVEAGYAFAVAGVVVLLGLLAGLDVVVAPVFGITLSSRPHYFAVIALFVTMAAFGAALALLVRAIIRGRVSIEKVSAGPATITLPSRSASYFDEYLDEIIYFFETNKKLDIVIIEDLDRFNDPNIFESLHSLNGILNSAKQLGGRNVRFIYAVRDSVFEKLGREQLENVTDEARAELTRANRTKFFELVVPVVPFITHRNARDLMASELTNRGHGVTKDLIDLAARHLADMRLIHNIINEYEVFKHRLLEVPQPVPELDEDRLFALVLFKNAHMADFEDIRHAASSLDKLWDVARDLIRRNADRLRAESRALRARAHRQAEVLEYIEGLAQELMKRIAVLAQAPRSGLATEALLYDGAAVTKEELTSPEFWRKFVAGTTPLTVEAHPPAYNHGTQPMELSATTIEALTGLSVDVGAFAAKALPNAERDIRALDEETSALLGMTWADLASQDTYMVSSMDDPQARNFHEWATELLPSRLATDLVVHGYITSYFPLHISSFYGTVVRPRAMTYVMRFVDARKTDPDFQLDPSDVEAIIWSEGVSVFTEISMLNVSIFDHLLTSRRRDAEIVLSNISDGSDAEDFSIRYLQAGLRKPEFVALVTPLWSEVFALLMSPQVLDDNERMELIDVAIAHRAEDLRYSLPASLRQRIESRYRQLPSLKADAQAAEATVTADFIMEIQAVLSEVHDLPDAATHVLRRSQSYLVNRPNLEVIAGTLDISLDALAEVEPFIVDYMAENSRAYVDACDSSHMTRHSVASSELLERFLSVAGSSDPSACDDLVKMAHPNCSVERIADVPSTAWGALFLYGHVGMSFENISSYVEDRGEVDDDLAFALSIADDLGDLQGCDEETVQKLALAIINSPSSELDVTKRVELAAALEPGVLPTAEIQPRTGKLIGELLNEKLIADDEEAFAPRLMLDWDTQAHAIANSQNFETLVSPEILNAEFIGPLLSDDSLSSVHYPVVKVLSQYPKAPLEAYQAYTDRALKGGKYQPKGGEILRARRGGVSVEDTLKLLAKFRQNVSSEELREVVRNLGYPWVKLADPGYGKSIHVPYSPHAQLALEELRSAGVVKNIKREGEVLVVTRRQK